MGEAGEEQRGGQGDGCRSLACVYNLISLLSFSASLCDGGGPAFPVAAKTAA